MNIPVRGLSPATGKYLERMAKERGISREEYVRNILENHALLEKTAPTTDRLEKQLAANTMYLEKVDVTMQSILEFMKEMMTFDDSSDSH